MGFGINMGLTKSDKGLNKQTMCQFRAGEGSVDVYAMVLPCPHPTHSTPAMLPRHQTNACHPHIMPTAHTTSTHTTSTVSHHSHCKGLGPHLGSGPGTTGVLWLWTSEERAYRQFKVSIWVLPHMQPLQGSCSVRNWGKPVGNYTGAYSQRSVILEEMKGFKHIWLQ